MATTTETATTQQSNKLNLPRTPVFKALARHPSEKTAIIHSASGKRFTYGSLLSDVSTTRSKILSLIDKDGVEDLKEQRVAMLVENGYEYVGVCFSTS
jgi:malonyl-CoA/methylmalonyl-CoA synthetase